MVCACVWLATKSMPCLIHFAAALSQMLLSSWRMSGEELLFEVRRVYRPVESHAASKLDVLDVARLSGPGLLGIEASQVRHIHETLAEHPSRIAG